MNKFLTFVERFRMHDPLLVESIIGGYQALIESISIPQFIYHETSMENALSILSDGFKTGKDLQKGEGTAAIFFAPSTKGMKGTAYSRGEGRRVRIEVSTDGIKLIDLNSLNTDSSLPSYKQPSYLIKQSIENNGEFPEGYDGAYLTNNDSSIYEIMLKPSVATEHMTGRVFNMKGSLIESDVGSDAMVFLHGGNLDNFQSLDDFNVWKKGRMEFGPGLYLTTAYETASKYAKGSRKLYRVFVNRGTDISKVKLKVDVLNSFIPTIVSKPKQKELMNSLGRYIKNGEIPASIFVNSLVNSELIGNSNGLAIRKFLVDNGVDYELVQNAFGWGETMLVLYNLNLIAKVERVLPNDRSIFDLPSINESVGNDYSGEILYHGTNANFADFDIDKSGLIKNSDWGKGIYFTRSKGTADQYRIDAVKHISKEYNDAYDEYEKYEKMKYKETDPVKKQEVEDLMFQSLKKFQEIGRKLNASKEGRLVTATINPGAKIYKHKSEGGMTDPFLGERVKAKGYDIILVDEDRYTEEFVVLNPSAIKITGEVLTESVSDFNSIISTHSIPELVNYDWNKIAFGFSNDDVLNIPLSKIKIKWKEDMANVTGFDMSKYFKDADYASLPPIEVSYDGKNFYLEDGHHRYGYAKKLNLKTVPAVVEITANPFNKLGFTIDDIVRYKKQSLTEATDDQMLMDELAEFMDSGYVPEPSKPAKPEKAPIKDGGTVRAYHGSNAVFDEFKKEKIGTNFPNTKDGFFFSDDLEYVDYLAKKLTKEKGGSPTRYTCELSLGRTYTLRNYFDTFTEDESSHMYGITQGDVIDIFDSFRNDIIAKAHANNCNSIHFKSHGINLYVVFESSQIRILDYTTLA